MNHLHPDPWSSKQLCQAGIALHLQKTHRFWSVAQSCLTPYYRMDCSLPGSSVHGISQARILEWVAISFSRGSSWPRDRICLCCIGRQSLNHWARREAPFFGKAVKFSVWACLWAPSFTLRCHQDTLLILLVLPLRGILQLTFIFIKNSHLFICIHLSMLSPSHPSFI